MFSCLISIYEKETPRNLEECLESILNQTVMLNEIVIVKDGHLTESLELVLEKYSCLFNRDITAFTTVQLEKNIGLGKALNEGIKHCSNKYIMRMDSDDIMKPNRVEVMTKLISKFPEIDVFGSQIEEFESTSRNILGIRKVPLDLKNIKRTIKYRNPMNHVSVVLKKSELIKVGGYPDFLFFEDYALWAKMISLNYQFRNCNEILVSVRAGIDMIGRRHGWFYAKQEAKMQNLLFHYRLTNIFWYLFNLIFRSLGRLAPKSLLQFGIKFYRES